MTGLGKRILCGWMCIALLCLSGCVSNTPVEKESVGYALPEVRSGPEAPVGDSQTDKSISAVLYIPDETATRLNAVVQTVTIESGKTKAEALVEALLNLITESGFGSSSQQLRLTPVSNAVETSRDLVTVNLHTSMRLLEAQEQFALRVAIINTLTELPELNYVNILVYGRDIGLDLAETIPTGVMARYPGNDIVSYWSRVDAERMSLEGELERTVALYFISEDGGYMLGEVRNMIFTDRNPATFAKAILEEMAKGATRIDGVRTLAPPQDYYERDPVLLETDDGNYIELHFHPGIEGYLSMRRSTFAMLLSSICYTLTGFIPKLEGIIVYVGGELVTEMEMMDGLPWVMQNGQITRESVPSLAADVCTVYYPLATGAGLYAVTRPIAQRQRTQPIALLRELMKPPEDTRLARALPEAITDADIIGLQIHDDTALLNVTRAFARACAGMTEVEERNMVYAIVNTLTEIEGVDRVRFFVDGTQSELAGHLFMGGEFLRHPGLVYTGRLQ